MISVVHPKRDEGESATTILGDILYGDKTKVRTSEKEWFGLVKSIAAGDQLALHSLYQQTYRIVFTLILRITNNRETAEEVTLDVYYEVWQRASAYDPADGPVAGWIMNLARSRAIDRLRFDHRKKRFPSDVAPPLIKTAGDDPQRPSHLEEQSRHLRNALECLTAEERRVIETAFFSELTYAEVAAKLNQPVGTVKTRIRSGLSKLRQVLTGRLGHL
jgi:RNA polymerase sigma-70 factor, ECF subfamily